MCRALKAEKHQPYGNLQSLSVPTHRWKDLELYDRFAHFNQLEERSI